MPDPDGWNLKESLGGLVGGAVVASFGVWMLAEPSRIAQEEYGPGKGGSIMRLIDAVWGIPGGVVLTLFGLLILGGTVAAMKSRGGGG